jgi:S1-C subfamily serine protease
MQRMTSFSIALLSIACSLAMPLAARTPSKHGASTSHTTTTYADSMHTQHDDQQLHLRSGDHGVVVELARPSPLIALMTGDVIRSVEGLRVDRVQALSDAVRRSKGSSLLLTVQRRGRLLQVRVSAKDLSQWMPPEPPAPPQAPR